MGEEIDGGEQGRLGGCGAPDNRLLRWSIGGVEIGGQWFNVAYGHAPGSASSIRLILSDGTARMDSNLQGNAGLWVVVVPGSPFDARNDFARIDLRDGTGSLIAQQEVPSLAAARQRARDHRARAGSSRVKTRNASEEDA